ncbi:MAG: GNAT family N-acetyltransferase [Caldilineaceae bacterium]|nr:GNAT family N-acetyltransferase [Caldilineaceae bacterium]
MNANHSFTQTASQPFIRQAAVADVPLLLPLVADYWAFESIPGFTAQRIASQLARLLSAPSRGQGWIALAEGMAVGYLLAVYVFSLEHFGLTAEIEEFFVLPTQRGNGVGAELLRIAEVAFIQAGCTNISLQLARGNDAARTFYHRFGYNERSAYELLDKTLHAG